MNYLKGLMYLRKSDRRVMLASLCVIVVALGVIFLAGENNETSNGVTVADSIPEDSVFRSTAFEPRKADRYAVGARPAERFPFDPNTADSTQLLRLGLQPWQVRNIYKYRAAGGVYRQPSDFARLYGLTVKQYRELMPYIRISKDYQPASSLLEKNISMPDKPVSLRDSAISRYPVKIGEGEYVVLNTADTSALKTIPGIGSYYARRIVEYGQRLGGYVSVSQIDEIEGIPAEAKKYLKVEDSHPRRMNVNRLSLEELRRHPYLNFFQARAITDYRRLHGPIKSLNDLRLSKDFPQEAIDRLTPYVEY